MNLFDTHCHLTDNRFNNDTEQVIQNAFQAGVSKMITIGTGIDDTKRALALAAESSGDIEIRAAGGMTPFELKDAQADDLNTLEDLLTSNSTVCAVGEIGLDRHHQLNAPEIEEQYFIAQLEMAQRLNLPAIIHCRDAHERMRELLHECRDSQEKGAVIHCYSGTYRDAVDYLDMGCILSFTCALGYPRAQELRDVVRKIPIDKIMTETDSPYLPPADKRGTRNEPAHVCKVAELVAELHHKRSSQTGDILFATAASFFGVTI